jgi:hypothetical protein
LLRSSALAIAAGPPNRTSCSCVRRHSAGYCSSPIAGVSASTSGAAPTVLQGPFTWARGKGRPRGLSARRDPIPPWRASQHTRLPPSKAPGSRQAPGADPPAYRLWGSCPADRQLQRRSTCATLNTSRMVRRITDAKLDRASRRLTDPQHEHRPNDLLGRRPGRVGTQPRRLLPLSLPSGRDRPRRSPGA